MSPCFIPLLNHNAANTNAARNSVFRIATYLTSGKKNRQNENAKIDISRARVVGRKFGSFDSIFNPDSDFSSSLIPLHTRDSHDPALLKSGVNSS